MGEVVTEMWTVEVNDFVDLGEYTAYNIISRGGQRAAHAQHRYSSFLVLHAQLQPQLESLPAKFPTGKKVLCTNAVKYKRVVKLGRYLNEVLAAGGANHGPNGCA